MTTLATTPRLVAAGGGHTRTVLGDRQRVVLDGADTGGSILLFEQRNEAGVGVPLHVHAAEEELFHVLEGEMEFTLDGRQHLAGPGTMVWLPRGVPHSFRTVSNVRAHVVLTPAGAASMFEELAALPPGPPDMGRVSGICDRYQVHFQSSPHFAAAVSPAAGAILGPDDGTPHDVLGIITTVKAAGGRTAGCSVFELTGPPGLGVPPHLHECEDETFIVLEGAIDITAGGATTRATPGMAAFLPRGQVHAFMIAGDTPARFVVVATPGGVEDMFAELAALPSGPPDMETVTAICARHGVRFA